MGAMNSIRINVDGVPLRWIRQGEFENSSPCIAYASQRSERLRSAGPHMSNTGGKFEQRFAYLF